MNGLPAMVARKLPRMLALARRMLGDASEAEDVAQEVMVRAWRQAPTWQPGTARFDSWMHRVALNLCYDRLRRQRERPMAEPPDQIDPGPAPDAGLMGMEIKDQVEIFDFSKYNFVTPIMKPKALTRGELLDGVMKNYRRFYMRKALFHYPWRGTGFRRRYLLGCLKAFDRLLTADERPARVADIGCGHGHSTLLMAQAFPNSRFHGFDTHAASIAEASRPVKMPAFR